MLLVPGWSATDCPATQHPKERLETHIQLDTMKGTSKHYSRLLTHFHFHPCIFETETKRLTLPETKVYSQVDREHLFTPLGLPNEHWQPTCSCQTVKPNFLLVAKLRCLMPTDVAKPEQAFCSSVISSVQWTRIRSIFCTKKRMLKHQCGENKRSWSAGKRPCPGICGASNLI